MMNEVIFQKGLSSLIEPPPLDEVNELRADADAAVQDFAAGRQRDIHQTMIALEKADVAFQLLMQVRNKIISAYETIMRMQA